MGVVWVWCGRKDKGEDESVESEMSEQNQCGEELPRGGQV